MLAMLALPEHDELSADEGPSKDAPSKNPKKKNGSSKHGKKHDYTDDEAEDELVDDEDMEAETLVDTPATQSSKSKSGFNRTKTSAAPNKKGSRSGGGSSGRK
jgi:hypothetical protein